MTEYKPRLHIDRDDICKCGHFWFYHKHSWKWLIGKPHGRCDNCTCPAFVYERTMVKEREGGEYGRIIAEGYEVKGSGKPAEMIEPSETWGKKYRSDGTVVGGKPRRENKQ